MIYSFVCGLIKTDKYLGSKDLKYLDMAKKYNELILSMNRGKKIGKKVRGVPPVAKTSTGTTLNLVLGARG